MKDPVCGMEVNPETAAGSYGHTGQMYYFCNPHCLEKFRLDPAKYLAPKPTQTVIRIGAPKLIQPSPTKQQVHTCPMHPEVRQEGPGSCPACGMALEPLTAAIPASRSEYVCPMHPEIVRSEPGSCPICGMALELRTVTVEEEANPELADMTLRFWICLVLTAPVFFLAMSEMIPGQPVQHLLPGRQPAWIQFGLATPVV
ncbi:MAG: YHS domain-containing protein, partial [Acidobacteria bacterium]|nr:YHS domain-containing protein [Acidobacteriota bacterium]